MKKIVLFSNKNESFSIPSYKDFDNEVKCILWWSDKELDEFYNNAREEIKYFLLYNPLLNFKDARVLLYQTGSLRLIQI